MSRWPSCRTSSAGRARRRRTTTAPASSSARPSTTSTAPTTMRARFGWSSAPVVEMLIPSTLDPTLAPAGKHVASLFVQHVPPPARRPQLGRRQGRVRRSGHRHAQHPRAQLQGQRDRPPGAIAARPGAPLRPARWRHFPRPADPGSALQRAARCWAMPTTACRVPGLYLCGAGAHPGGGVTGLPGRNAALEIIRDFRRRRWMGAALTPRFLAANTLYCR